MNEELQKIIKKTAEEVGKIKYVDSSKIPSIDLYMDQITTFMEEQLTPTKRYADDKILTKTMINNYAKNELIPPPIKKKYCKEHILLLTFIFVLSLRKITFPFSRAPSFIVLFVTSSK